MASVNECFQGSACFDLLLDTEKDKLLEERKAKNTNRATKQWVSAFTQYLKEKQAGEINNVTVQTLPKLLEDFYFSLRKQKKKEPKKKRSKLQLSRKNDPDGDSDDTFYKNSSLRSARAALNRHFKSTLGIDIISNEQFIKATEVFQAVSKKGKTEGHGEVKSKKPISDADMSKLLSYFVTNMKGPPNAKLLQEIVLFNIIYYGGRRGHENLREMTKKTFQISRDTDGRQFIHQVIKEFDKNHKEDDFSENNESRIYEMPGETQHLIDSS